MATLRGVGPSNPFEWSIPGLPASGPAPGAAKRLQLFGQFVGDWDIVEHRAPLSRPRPPGEVHFNWVLGGLAIQDVWGSLEPKPRRFVPWGTTLRYYDGALGAWRSTWIAPRQHRVRCFVGRQEGDEIVLREAERGLRTERWIFSDIRPGAFRWYALRRRHSRGPWEPIEEMRLVRRARPPESPVPSACPLDAEPFRRTATRRS